MEMRNMLLETRGKVLLVIKWQRAWLNCVHIIHMLKKKQRTGRRKHMISPDNQNPFLKKELYKHSQTENTT